MANLSRYRGHPFEMMHRLSEEFEDFFRRPWGGQSLATQELFAPLDLQEEDREYILKMDIPGFKESDIKINCDHNRCVLTGERKEEKTENKGGYVMRERGYGRFQRVIPLPTEVKTEEVRARYKEGVLEVHFPKAQKASSKEIKVEAAK